MKREDFIFDHMDDEYEDYWFKVVGDTKDELTKKYMEMCMVSVTEVVYSNNVVPVPSVDEVADLSASDVPRILDGFFVIKPRKDGNNEYLRQL